MWECEKPQHSVAETLCMQYMYVLYIIGVLVEQEGNATCNVVEMAGVYLIIIIIIMVIFKCYFSGELIALT